MSRIEPNNPIWLRARQPPHPTPCYCTCPPFGFGGTLDHVRSQGSFLLSTLLYYLSAPEDHFLFLTRRVDME